MWHVYTLRSHSCISLRFEQNLVDSAIWVWLCSAFIHSIFIILSTEESFYQCVFLILFFSFETKDLTIMQLWLFWILLGRPHCSQTHRDLSASIARALGWMVCAPHPRFIPDSSVRISWLCSHTSCEPRYFIGHCVFARRTLLSLLLHRSALRLKAGCCSALYRFC